MYVMDKCWLKIPIGLLTLRNGVFTEVVSKKLEQIFEAGLVQKWKREQLDKIALKGVFKKKSMSQEKQLSVTHFKGLFVFLLMSHFMCVLIFLLEIRWK